MAAAFGHATGLPDASAGLAVSQLDGRTGLRLAGQADLCTAGLLKQAAVALPPGAAEIHLQVAGLEFIDVAAARELVMLISRPARPRRILHYPLPVMLRLLAFVLARRPVAVQHRRCPPGHHLRGAADVNFARSQTLR